MMAKMRWAALGVAALGVLAAWALWASREPPAVPWVEPTLARDDPRVLAFVIPQGTARKIMAGGKVAVFPSEVTLTARVKDTLIIVNEDEIGHGVGPFWVGAGESFTLRFGTPRTYTLGCSLDPQHVFRIVVREPPARVEGGSRERR